MFGSLSRYTRYTTMDPEYRLHRTEMEIAATAVVLQRIGASTTPPLLEPDDAANEAVHIALKGKHRVLAKSDHIHCFAKCGYRLLRTEAAGDCAILSTMADHEISRVDRTLIKHPNSNTRAMVIAVRKHAIEMLLNPIDGVTGESIRAAAGLPPNVEKCRQHMSQWLSSGFWNPRFPNDSSAFLFGMSMFLGRPIVILTETESDILQPICVYGQRLASNTPDHFVIRKTLPQSGHDLTIMPFYTMTLFDVLEMLKNPYTECSVLLHSDNHFNALVRD